MPHANRTPSFPSATTTTAPPPSNLPAAPRRVAWVLRGNMWANLEKRGAACPIAWLKRPALIAPTRRQPCRWSGGLRLSAKLENRPFQYGYARHWCHVMERESFGLRVAPSQRQLRVSWIAKSALILTHLHGPWLPSPGEEAGLERVADSPGAVLRRHLLPPTRATACRHLHRCWRFGPDGKEQKETCCRMQRRPRNGCAAPRLRHPRATHARRDQPVII